MPTCEGVVRWAIRPPKTVRHIEWVPLKGAPKRIAYDRAIYLFHELPRQGVTYRPSGAGKVASVRRPSSDGLFNSSLPRGGGPGVGAAWEVFDFDGDWWLRVARTRMPLDALVWRLTYSEATSRATG